MPTNEIPSWRRTNNDPYIVEDIKRLTEAGVWELKDYEIWWQDHQRTLEIHGYLLRPRFRPGWKPSWLGTDLIPQFCEDSIVHPFSQVIDARRINDNSLVMIKKLEKNSEEYQLLQYFMQSERKDDPTNHCVHVFDFFADELDPETDFIVMPFLRPFYDPPFSATSEVIEFFRQTLEGLHFIHKNGVAHRDCSNGNIMFDGDQLYPQGFHPTLIDHDVFGRREIKGKRRKDVPSVKYYYIDFGISLQYEPDEPRLANGKIGQDLTIPELSIRKPYNPFLVDICILGNVYRRNFLDKYDNFEFLRPLVDAMTAQEPSARPPASECVERFASLSTRRSGLSLRWRLRPRKEKLPFRIINDTASAMRECSYMACWVFTGKFITNSLIQHSKKS